MSLLYYEKICAETNFPNQEIRVNFIWIAFDLF